MEELLSHTSTEITRAPNEPLWISKIDLAFAYGQLKLSEKTSKHYSFAITGGNMNGFYRFKKGCYGLSDIPTILQEKIDRTLNYQTPVWLDDIIIVARHDKDKQLEKLFKILKQLQEAGYRANEKKSEFFSEKNHLAGTQDNRVGNNTEQGKDKSDFTIETTDIIYRIKIISRSNTIPCKVYTQTFGKKLTE